MAIMERCFCFSNVRSGSQACGVYSLIASIIYLGISANNLIAYVKEPPALFTRSQIDGIYAAHGMHIIVLAFILIASIVLLVGILYENEAMLIPYMVAITALMTVQVISWIILFALFGHESAFLISKFFVWILCTALNITCLLCVISQYQELRGDNGWAALV